jgi:hypothetical protein
VARTAQKNLLIAVGIEVMSFKELIMFPIAGLDYMRKKYEGRTWYH